MQHTPHFIRGILFILGAVVSALVIYIEFTHGIFGVGPVRVAKLSILVVILLGLGFRDLFFH